MLLGSELRHSRKETPICILVYSILPRFLCRSVFFSRVNGERLSDRHWSCEVTVKIRPRTVHEGPETGKVGGAFL